MNSEEKKIKILENRSSSEIQNFESNSNEEMTKIGVVNLDEF